MSGSDESFCLDDKEIYRDATSEEEFPGDDCSENEKKFSAVKKATKRRVQSGKDSKDTSEHRHKKRTRKQIKVAPYSDYKLYERSDVEFFISLFAGREELYDPNEELTEARHDGFCSIEKRCQHFLALRKGRNAEKLWMVLFRNFEKDYRNSTRNHAADKQENSQFSYYHNMEFLIPFLEKTMQDETKCTSYTKIPGFKAEPRVSIKPESTVQDEYREPSRIVPNISYRSASPAISLPTASASAATVAHKEPTTTASNVQVQEKYADIITCIVKYLDEVPNDKMMLTKVRLFQFIEREKNKLQDNH